MGRYINQNKWCRIALKMEISWGECRNQETCGSKTRLTPMVEPQFQGWTTNKDRQGLINKHTDLGASPWGGRPPTIIWYINKNRMWFYWGYITSNMNWYDMGLCWGRGLQGLFVQLQWLTTLQNIYIWVCLKIAGYPQTQSNNSIWLTLW